MAGASRNAVELERRQDVQSERLDNELIGGDVDDAKAVAIRSLLWTANKKKKGFTYQDVRRTHGAWGEAVLLPWLLERGFVAKAPSEDKYITVFISEIHLDRTI